MPIAELFIYPIKSCGGISVEHFLLNESGPEYDRIFTLVDSVTGVMISQRTHPTLALVKPQFDPKTGDLVVEAAGTTPITIPLHGDRDGEVRTIQIHKDSCKARKMKDEYSEWFSEFLHVNCTLVRYDPDAPRIRRADALGRDISVSFADGYPILMTSVQSLAELNLRITANKGMRVPMDRFRPNIVVDKEFGPYGEDGLPPKTRVKINDAVIEAGKLCERCPITTVNQATGTRSFKEPLATLAQYRKVGSGVLFGRTFGVVTPGIVSIKARLEFDRV